MLNPKENDINAPKHSLSKAKARTSDASEDPAAAKTYIQITELINRRDFYE